MERTVAHPVTEHNRARKATLRAKASPRPWRLANSNRVLPLRPLVILLLLCGLMLAREALAMSSTNYRLAWLTRGTGSGGGASGSAGYAVQMTMGQAAIGHTTSDNYSASLGYWQAEVLLPEPDRPEFVFLPLVVRR